MAELKDLTNHDSVRDQIRQYSNLISLTADNLQDLKARVKSLDNGNYEQELNAINGAQQKLYQALKSIEI
jgi:aromatic ring hydroxylase